MPQKGVAGNDTPGKLLGRDVRRLAILLVPVLVAGGILGWLRCSDPRGPRPNEVELDVPPDTPDFELALGGCDRITVGTYYGGDRWKVLCTRDGATWAFVGSHGQGLSYRRRDGAAWTPLTAITGPGWSFINNLAAVEDAAGRPVLFWSGFDGEAGEALATAAWSGSGWTAPQILDREPPCEAATGLDAVRDTVGNLHVVYDKPLNPPEKYSVGFIIVDGAFPTKPHHILLDGRSTPRPKPTTGPGRFYVHRPKLSAGPEGRVYLSTDVSPLAGEGEWHHIAYQVWDGKGWSGFVPASPDNSHLLNGEAVVDPWGGKVVWWGLMEPMERYCRTIVRGHASDAERLSGYGYPAPVLATLPGKGVLMMWGGDQSHVRLWNGRTWSATLSCPTAEELAVGSDGRVYLAGRRDDFLTLQEALVRKRGQPIGAGR
ncbi:MAG: hypothetical protein FJ290_10750 [Planctomycetes bacterium]|nr:hypothetical protein [Planctomycetota bacterium]